MENEKISKIDPNATSLMGEEEEIPSIVEEDVSDDLAEQNSSNGRIVIESIFLAYMLKEVGVMFKEDYKKAARWITRKGFSFGNPKSWLARIRATFKLATFKTAASSFFKRSGMSFKNWFNNVKAVAKGTTSAKALFSNWKSTKFNPTGKLSPEEVAKRAKKYGKAKTMRMGRYAGRGLSYGVFALGIYDILSGWLRDDDGGEGGENTAPYPEMTDQTAMDLSSTISPVAPASSIVTGVALDELQPLLRNIFDDIGLKDGRSFKAFLYLLTHVQGLADDRATQRMIGYYLSAAGMNMLHGIPYTILPQKVDGASKFASAHENVDPAMSAALEYMKMWFDLYGPEAGFYTVDDAHEELSATLFQDQLNAAFTVGVIPNRDPRLEWIPQIANQ